MTSNDTLRNNLKAAASDAVAKYPQYNGHFNDYVLVKITKNVKSKLGGLAFTANEYAIAKPIIYTYDRIMRSGKTKPVYTIVVWSNRHQIDTHVIMDEVQFIDGVGQLPVEKI